MDLLLLSLDSHSITPCSLLSSQVERHRLPSLHNTLSGDLIAYDGLHVAAKEANLIGVEGQVLYIST